jgi:hypothetical protein
MMVLPRLSPAILALLILAGPALAATDGDYVHDGANLFDAGTIVKANEQIAELQEKTHIAVWVRTLSKLPEDKVQAWSKMPVKQQAVSFQAFAAKEAQEAGLHGIILLISNDPSFRKAIVAVNPKDLEVRFTDFDCEQVRRVLASSPSGTKPNEILLDAIEKVRSTVMNRSEATSISWPLIGAIIAGLVGLWLLLGVIRMRLMQSRTDHAGETQGRKNSLVSGLLGGMFGAVAGHWIYDTLFDHKKPTPPAEVAPGKNPLDDQIELSEGEKGTEQKKT